MKIFEVYKAFGEGKKLKRRGWLSDQYIYLCPDSHCLIDENGADIGDVGNLDIKNMTIYIEPKPKVMRAQYAYQQLDFKRPSTTEYLYENEDDFLKGLQGVKLEWFKRLEEISCES